MALLAQKIHIDKMTNKYLVILLKPHKRKEDVPMPTKNSVIIEKYHQWKNLPPLTFDVVGNEDAIGTEEETVPVDEEAATVGMMMIDMDTQS